MKAAEQLLGFFAGILVSDRHGAYGTHPSDQRQLCWAHIIRNLERIAGYKGDAGELGRWLVHFARIIIQLEHRWRKSGYQSEHYRRRLLAARENFKHSLEHRASTWLCQYRRKSASKSREAYVISMG